MKYFAKYNLKEGSKFGMKKIRRNTVNQAIEFIRLNTRSKERQQTEIQENTKLQQIYSHCKIRHQYKTEESQYCLSFSQEAILSEMKSHVVQRNWSKVRNLLLLLLRLSTDIEPLMWRYSFILTLYGNIDNLFNVSEFFRMCIGSLDSDKAMILKHLLLLSCNK